MYFSEEEKEKGKGIVKRFIISYAKICNSEKREALLEWLKKEFRSVFKEETDEEIKIRSENILRGVEQYYKEKQKVLEKKSKGLSSEEIITDELVEVIENDDSTEEEKTEILRNTMDLFSKNNESRMYQIAYNNAPITTLKTLREKAIIEKDRGLKNDVDDVLRTLSTSAMTNSVGNIERVLQRSNDEVFKTLFTKKGTVNQNPNLDGFLFEDFHANTFNIDAAVKGKEYIAKAIKPEEGVYTKNSVDIQMYNKNGDVIHRYQAKSYSDSKKTDASFYNKDGYKYRGQSKLVPSDQINDVSNSVDKISHDGVSSKSISKGRMKEITEDLQKDGDMNKVDRLHRDSLNHYAASRMIAKQTIYGAGLGMVSSLGFDVASKLIKGEEIVAEEVIENAIVSGSRIGLSTAVAGGINYFGVVKGGMVGKVLGNSTVAGAIGASSIDIISSFYKLGKGEIGISEATSEISSSIAGSIATFATQKFLMGKAAAVLASVGITIGGGPLALITGAVVGLASTKVGQIVKKGIKKIVNPIANVATTVVSAGCKAVKTVAKAGYGVVKTVCNTVCSGAKAVASGIGSTIASIGSAIGGLFGW